MINEFLATNEIQPKPTKKKKKYYAKKLWLKNKYGNEKNI